VNSDGHRPNPERSPADPAELRGLWPPHILGAMVRLTRFTKRLIRPAMLGLVLLTLFAPTVAWAQDNAPPQPSLKTYPPVWIGYLVMAVLLGMVVAVSLLPSKRGHQD